MSRLPINDASPILNSKLDYNNLRFGDDFGTDRKGISSHAPSNFDKSTKERKTPKVDFDKLEKMSGMSTLMDGYDDDDSDDAPPPLGPKAAMPANQVKPTAVISPKKEEEKKLSDISPIKEPPSKFFNMKAMSLRMNNIKM